uniref:Uncharacterized protein n=1 Tax=Strongyloides stercoralis TaxID=6248 RepID=A0AAF5DIK4_STRER
MEAVALLELYRKRVNFFLLGGIHLELMLVTIMNPGGIHLVIILITIENPGMFFSVFLCCVTKFRHYCYCFGGCYSTGTLNLKHGNSFVKDSFNDNANFDKEHGVVLEAVFQLGLN